MAFMQSTLRFMKQCYCVQAPVTVVAQEAVMVQEHNNTCAPPQRAVHSLHWS